MNIKEIAVDSIKYPFLDWKKILILGLIVVIYVPIISAFNLHDGFTYQFFVIALLINFFITDIFSKLFNIP